MPAFYFAQEPLEESKPMQKKNPLKLNKLQLRTLALAQVLARDPAGAITDAETGEVTLTRLPHAHGNHVHVGAFVVSSKDASGFDNPAVWVALKRKGLVREEARPGGQVTLMPQGLEYDTGLGDKFLEPSDH
ncbi:hypothetical protein [Aestuariispira insulae]|uniref:Uncharacterized protein n=1 Tax=Aestuariispira insulae TaxID=1461337 RepID=A0A3D9HV44_9PROT|nr:hypothetical protein [Aestuariispira insulae]RED53362.1 hypothetical protein DFP90_101149 [Aestuariispira insulae]